MIARSSPILSCHPSLSSIPLDTASKVCTERIHVNLCKLANTGASMCRSPLENVAHVFIFTSSAVFSTSCSSRLDGL